MSRSADTASSENDSVSAKNIRTANVSEPHIHKLSQTKRCREGISDVYMSLSLIVSVTSTIVSVVGSMIVSVSPFRIV